MAKVVFTAGRVSGFKCDPDKSQAFLWDVTAPGLGLRATPAGKPSYIFQSEYQGKSVRLTIGSPDVWSIPLAQEKAKALQRLIDDGKDPRDLKRDNLQAKARQAAADAAQAQQQAAASLTVGDIWPRYLAEGKPKRKEKFKPRYLADLTAMAALGGVKKKRGQGLTRSGPLYPLLALALVDVTEDALQVWFEREALAGRHQAARALMMFRGFLRWCAARPEYRKLIDREAGRAPAILENLPANTRRTDALAAAQLKSWWQAVEQLSNRTASVYLRGLLLTGARKEELAALTWANVDFRWRKLTIADKVVTSRTIPLTPYLAQMLATLPRKNDFVFAGAGKTGHITEARRPLDGVLKESGVDRLTIHGIRRTFTQRGRAKVPAGAVAQIQGHTPSATAEGYNILTLDDLRPYAEQIEASILHSAGVVFDAAVEPG